MNLVQETQALRETLAAWAAEPEWELLCRYDLLRKNPSPSIGDRWFRRVKNMLARVGLVSPHVTNYSWLPKLKHAQYEEGSRILLIWAIGIEGDELRADCEGFLKRLDPTHGIVPVLITDYADFTYFSRLQWLVEYVPELSGTGVSYHERKKHYLAWRYRGALIVPASAGRASEAEWNKVMGMKH